MKHLLAITTCPDSQTAEMLASHLVESRLAACVNIIPGIRSIYEWKGEISRDQELILLIKTREDLYPRLEQAIIDRHPYELPEIIALPIEGGSSGYLGWLDAQLGIPQ